MTTMTMDRSRRRALEVLAWLVAALAVWATVGSVPAIVALLLIVGERVVRPDGHVLATAAVVLLALVPVAWFLGSSLPLFPPSLRLNDNLVAHQLGGLAIWTLFLAACVEIHPRESDSQ